MEAPTRIRKQSEKNVKGTDVLEKDDIELRLEKALFGDDAGFLDSLKRSNDTEHRSLVRFRDDESEESDAEDAEDGRLSDVADEDVRPALPHKNCAIWLMMTLSSSFLTLVQVPSLPRSPENSNRLPPHKWTSNGNKLGMTATTTVLPYLWLRTQDCANYGTPQTTT